MQHRYIGKTGLRVTPICLGTMGFSSWSDEKESFKIMDKAVDFGINFFDTAELYPVPPKAEYAGETESIIGRWLKGKQRDKLIIASKVAGARPSASIASRYASSNSAHVILDGS